MLTRIVAMAAIARFGWIIRSLTPRLCLGAQLTRPHPRRRARADVGPLTAFAEFVAQRRHVLGLTQLDLADLADVGVSTVRNVEAGRASPTLEVTLRVLNALGSTLVGMSHASVDRLPRDAVDLSKERIARR